jgi:hypothetical protein
MKNKQIQYLFKLSQAPGLTDWDRSYVRSISDLITLDKQLSSKQINLLRTIKNKVL